jgi:hypothetical protein
LDITVDELNNLITAASGGTFGMYPPATPANTGDATNPYPGLAPDFTYVVPSPAEATPDDGEYTIQNIMNDNFNNTGYRPGGTWWRIADHTRGNETGRFMLVNGYQPGAVFFTTEVDVKANTDYLFSAWIINVYKQFESPPGIIIANPEFSVKITGEDGEILYEAPLGGEIPREEFVPQWKQIGTVINTQDNSRINIEFISEGPAAFGNDYAVDDVSLNEVIEPPDDERCLAITELIQSAALQEAAMAHILNAEGEKIQEAVAMLKANEATPEQVAAINDSASQLIESLNMLEYAILSKLRLFADSDCM